MKNRLLSVCALILLLFPLCACAEEQPVIINLVEDASQDYRFEEDAPLLEIVFPRVISSDCAILRFEDQVMMIDSSTRSEKMNNRIRTACQTIGVDHIDIAYNSHPHNDQSAMLMVQYGDRRILFAGDNENRSQKYYVENPPACGLNADILKYPHHGQVRLNNDFLALISPSLAFLDGAADTIKDGVKYCQKHEIAHLLGYKGLTRLRTDGSIWVIDYLKEENADRELPYTPVRE